MDYFHRRDGILHAEDVPLPAIAAAVGTPTYVYSRATLEHHVRVLDQAFAAVPHRLCYAVKACSNLAVLGVLARAGCGFDIVSVGELERVLAAGGEPGKVVFSGVGKRDDEIARALQVGIACFNVESAGELDRIERAARDVGVRAPVALRVNPDVDARTHAYIATGLQTSKFGVPMAEATALTLRAAASPHLEVIGLDCHIGSQIVDIAPLVEALDRVLAMVDVLQRAGVALRHVDMGGGLGIRYRDEDPAPPAALGRAYAERLSARGLALWLEPGRVIVGNAGALLTRVIGHKRNGTKSFVIVDAAMNDNLRPALYDAWQALEPVEEPTAAEAEQAEIVDVVGPICETGDFLGRDRALPPLAAGALLAMRSAGAYGFAMASNYNSRPRAAEVLVQGRSFAVARARERVEELWRGERRLDALEVEGSQRPTHDAKACAGAGDGEGS